MYTQALSTKTGCPAEGSFETESGETGKVLQCIDKTEITQDLCMLKSNNFFSKSPAYKWHIDVKILILF